MGTTLVANNNSRFNWNAIDESAPIMLTDGFVLILVYITMFFAGRCMALIEKQASGREEEKGGEGMIKIPDISPYIEGWLLEYRSPKHKMSAPPPVQHLTSADTAHIEKRNDISETKVLVDTTYSPEKT